MNNRESKILELQVEIDFINYISDYADNYKKYDFEYHKKRLDNEDISQYDKEYNERELNNITYQREYIKTFISKI